MDIQVFRAIQVFPDSVGIVEFQVTQAFQDFQDIQDFLDIQVKVHLVTRVIQVQVDTVARQDIQEKMAPVVTQAFQGIPDSQVIQVTQEYLVILAFRVSVDTLEFQVTLAKVLQVIQVIQVQVGTVEYLDSVGIVAFPVIPVTQAFPGIVAFQATLGSQAILEYQVTMQ